MCEVPSTARLYGWLAGYPYDMKMTSQTFIFSSEKLDLQARNFNSNTFSHSLNIQN